MRNWNSICPVQCPRGFTDACSLRSEILCPCLGMGGVDAELEQHLPRPVPQRIYGRMFFAVGNSLPMSWHGRGRCGTGIGGIAMGVYVNPGCQRFAEAVSSEIYVDKTELIAYTNRCLNTEQKYICVSRPRRFGKSMAAYMLAAYYSRGIESEELFRPYRISQDETFLRYMNEYNLVFLNMQSFLSRSSDLTAMLARISRYLLKELLHLYPHIDYIDREDLIEVLQSITQETGDKFVFIIDEWDCIFRERKNHAEEQRQYLDFLRVLLKDQVYVSLAYMTGILPIKKYGTHSALNMFDEYSMANPGKMARFAGFTEPEVKDLCEAYHMDFQEARRWYDGYSLEGEHIYSPKSVVSSMLSHCYDSYWNQTETFEALKTYIMMNFDGLKDSVTRLLAGDSVRVNTESFSNDMSTFHIADDILTLLIHLGYLTYDFKKKEVHIPNFEVAGVFAAAVRTSEWVAIANALENSERLLFAILRQDEKEVAAGVEAAHLETSILTYNNENALSYTIALALYCAREYYMMVREFPTGKGYADIVYVPRRNHSDKPALVVELKWNKSAQGAIAQIQQNKYPESLIDFGGKILLVGVNYDSKTKVHECEIQEVASCIVNAPCS